MSKRGADTNNGKSSAESFLTVQKGVDALEPGDVLTIAPGEYFEAVKRTGLGDLAHDTIIRAELPGTVTLRGDLPAPEFRPLPGQRFVYVADFKFAGPIPAVNEIDTLTILKRMPNNDELEFIPGTFCHDAAAGKLYLSTSDMQPADVHRYSVSVIPTHGLHLIRPQRVTIEGLAFTGFHAMELLHYREETAGGVWGIFLVHGKQCVIRDCKAYLNAWGIGLNCSAPASGDNLVERCEAWGNKSPFANGDLGGITLLAARRDVVRNSTAYANGMYGVNIYGTGGAPPGVDDGGNDEKNKSLLEGNLSWGNGTADIKIKTGYEYFHVARNCISPGLWSVSNVTQGTIGRSTASKTASAEQNIRLQDIANLDLRAEFADPDHHDYRLQGTSRFRGAGPDGADQGAIPYAPNVFYVNAATGDDDADGLSAGKAWKTLPRAVRDLKPGDTLFLEPGKYPKLSLSVRAKPAAPIFIRGRGTGKVIVDGASLHTCHYVRLSRLTFAANANVTDGINLAFEHCEFASSDAPLNALQVRTIAISQCLFARSAQPAANLRGCERVDLRGNAFQNTAAPAVQLSNESAIRYANYNGYTSDKKVWLIGSEPWSLAEVQRTRDQQSQIIKRESASVLEAFSPQLAACGALGKPIGPYRNTARTKDLRLVTKPSVHSVSATTANLEWVTSLPATCQLAWGETPACEKSLPFNVNCFGTYSLTGLKPGQTYYFRITKLETPHDILPKTDLKQSVELADEPIMFTTLTKNAEPRIYHVATDGNDTNSGLSREQAWRSIRYAAAHVNVGDTVQIAGGKYLERARIRATGDVDSPITFRAAPGERVELNGNGMTLNSAFVAAGKSHLRFDGFYFVSFNLFPNDSWSLLNSGEFHLYQGKDIQITRCFSEGRGGYSASPVAAWFVEDLLIKNCVNTYKFGGMYFWRCPNLRIENTVFAEPMIMAFVLRNEKDQAATMENCIFTDMLDKKARLNLALLCCDGAVDSYRCPSSCFMLRDCIPQEQRALLGNQTIGQLSKHVSEPVFADPLFAGDPGVKGNPADKAGFSPDRMMDSALKLDFDSFFATNPELKRRGIGLDPAAFGDRQFQPR
ncbi:hypothetical protein [Anatilimnocola floriformis]|uniref:hypothetical protein n=1 Tax=Anatilimnocola floriformis TaxID=2948575 RepID=UPI0020C2E871|nr:hypothetical protein [Anatilimnocola floriformis]